MMERVFLGVAAFVVLAFSAAALTTASEPTGGPPPLPEPWESLIPFDCSGSTPGYEYVRNGVSECHEGVLASCFTEGLQSNPDCRGIAQATALFTWFGEDYPESFSSYAWRRYDFGICMAEQYALNSERLGVSEAKFLAGYHYLCGGSPVQYGVDEAPAEDKATWLDEAENPIDATEIGDPVKCSVQYLCSQSGDTNPQNAGFRCPDGSLPHAGFATGGRWAC